eukprot:jgi/Bigna1/141776/aug1.65_g16484
MARGRTSSSKNGKSSKSLTSQGSFSSAVETSILGGVNYANGGSVPPGPYVIMHTGAFYQVWWYTVAFSAVISGIFTPLIMAFYNDLLYAEIPLDIVFYIDIVITFFVSVQIHGWTITNNWIIAQEYLRFWFWIDLIAIIPFEFMVGGNSHGQFLRLFRLLRLRRLFPLFAKAEKSRFCNFTLVSVVKYFSMAAYYGHWSACIFYELASIQDYDEGTWVAICVPGLEKRPTSIRYLISIYWAFTTLTTVGYGDISPQNSDERVWGTIYVIINLGLQAYIVGNMTALASKPDLETHQFRQQLDDVQVFMKQNNIPLALRAQVIQFLQLQQRMKTTAGNDLVNSLPYAIRMPIKKHQYSEILEQIDIFRGVSKPFLNMVMANVEEEVFMPSMQVINCSDLSSSFYMIIEGECELLVSPTGNIQEQMDNEVPCAKIGVGSHFGCEGFFSSSNQPYTIRVTEVCVVMKMEARVRRIMLQQHPRDLQVVTINIKRRLEIMIDMITAGLRPSDERIMQRGNKNEAIQNNFLGGEKKSSLKSRNTTTKLLETYDYKPRKRRRGRSSRQISNFSIEEYSRPFLISVHEVRQNIKLFMERREQTLASLLCQLASVGDHTQLRRKLHGLDLSEDSGDYDGRVPLHLACSRGHLEACKVLLEFKANPSHVDNFGVTPLQECVYAGNDSVLEFMLKNGAELKIKHEGQKVYEICNIGDIRTLGCLLKAKCDPNAQNYYKRTGLHSAATEGNLSIVKLLLKYRANPYVPDRNGLDAIDQATELRNKVLIDVMTEFANEHGMSKEVTLKNLEDLAKADEKEKETSGGNAGEKLNPAQKEGKTTETKIGEKKKKKSGGDGGENLNAARKIEMKDEMKE